MIDKDILEFATGSVKAARKAYDNLNSGLYGAISALEHQGCITETLADFFRGQLDRLQTESKKIEIEFYKIRNLGEV